MKELAILYHTKSIEPGSESIRLFDQGFEEKGVKLRQTNLNRPMWLPSQLESFTFTWDAPLMIYTPERVGIHGESCILMLDGKRVAWFSKQTITSQSEFYIKIPLTHPAPQGGMIAISLLGEAVIKEAYRA